MMAAGSLAKACHREHTPVRFTRSSHKGTNLLEKYKVSQICLISERF